MFLHLDGINTSCVQIAHNAYVFSYTMDVSYIYKVLHQGYSTFVLHTLTPFNNRCYYNVYIVHCTGIIFKRVHLTDCISILKYLTTNLIFALSTQTELK